MVEGIPLASSHRCHTKRPRKKLPLHRLPVNRQTPTPPRKVRCRLGREPTRRFNSSMDFREATVDQQKWGRLPHFKVADGRSMEMLPVPKNGNCGFQAIAWGLLLLHLVPEHKASSLTVRKRLAEHVTSDGEFYASKLIEFGMVDVTDCEDAGEELSRAFECIQAFGSDILREGLNGHWLCESFGPLEIMAIAGVYDVRIEIYTYCTRSGMVRLYQEAGEGDATISLLFSGKNSSGHFDLLGRDSRWSQRLREWWRRVQDETPKRCRRAFEEVWKAGCKPMLAAMSAAVKNKVKKLELWELVKFHLYYLSIGSSHLGRALTRGICGMCFGSCSCMYSDPLFDRGRR